ncbi:DUF6178 family protein, partial [Thermodesulfobacteriota bacterium]
MNDNPVKFIRKKSLELFHKRKGLLPLPPEKVLEAILDDPQPAALVHSFPEEDFYLLVQEIGPENSLPLLALASDRQWEYMSDIEVWEGDRIANGSVTRWLNLFLKADPQRFVDRYLKANSEFIELYLCRNLDVKIREHDQDPSEFSDEYFTLDGTYYLKYVDDPFDTQTADVDKQKREEF